jgi:hypothetical protein
MLPSRHCLWLSLLARIQTRAFFVMMALAAFVVWGNCVHIIAAHGRTAEERSAYASG